MKKLLLFIAASLVGGITFINAQTTFGIYTDDAMTSVAQGVNFSWVNGMTNTEITGTDNYYSFSYNASSSYGMAEMSMNTTDLSAFSTGGVYHISIKTTSIEPFHIRFRDSSGNDKRIAFNNGSDPAGFLRDGQWHNLSIPFTDFYLGNGTEPDWSVINKPMVLRTGTPTDGNLSSQTAGIFDIDIDNIYLSVTPTAIEDIDAKELSIYPNPAKDFITVCNVADIDGDIYSLTGQKVKNILLSGNKIDVSDLEKGVYVLSINAEGKKQMKKFIKE